MLQSKQPYAGRRLVDRCPRCAGQMFVDRGMEGGSFDEIVCLQCGHRSYRDVVVPLPIPAMSAAELQAA